ncbi:MAG: ferrous iron transport protein A [Candidatus Omnitrophota bacterium]
MTDEIKNLTAVRSGKQCIFLRLEGGGRRAGRLADIGLIPGQPLRVLQNFGHGPVTIQVKGSRVALGHGVARRIIVKDSDHE